MNKYFVLRVISFILLTSSCAFAQSFDRKDIERTTKQAIKKAYATSVRIWGYDTVKQQQNSSQFSGVVVSAAGHILTVAHATVPGQTYKVFFTDGKEYIAIALGRIGFKEKQNMPDVAMLQIIGKGNWPYAEMGWSSSLKNNELCLSISYPETLDQKLPAVRFGRISNPMTEWGFVQSTCKMEPGDSGGPLYDYMGRVIALHSRIDKPEDVNFEVPVDLYRKYWTALQKPEDYAVLPLKEDVLKADPIADKIKTIPGLNNLTANFVNYDKQYSGTLVIIRSMAKGKPQRIGGTVFSLKRMVIKGTEKNGKYIVSKNSVVGENPELLSAGAEVIKLKVLARDQENDLVLLQAVENESEALMPGGLVLKSTVDTLSPVFKDLGSFLISPLAENKSKVGILGSLNFSLPRKFSIGFFGAGANFQNEQIILTRMAPGSPAADGKLELGDQITGINGVPINRPEQYGGELMKYSPGDSISIQGVRKGNKYSLMIGIRLRPATTEHPAEHFEGGKSVRLDGFGKVFVQDAAILAEECGGPVFDANGRFYGINIARFSRTSTLVMPASVVFNFIGASI
jgi:serine protease Do